nr:uncharacterized protein LOC109741581 [Aegilops tauschii subsp. strangulata]
MRLRPGLKHNFTVLVHAHFFQRLFQLNVEPEAEEVQAFFDNLSENYVRDEPLLIRDTTKEELDYIAARAVEAALAKEAGSVATVKDKADTAAEEKELAGWAESVGEASSVGAGSPLVEDVVEESAEEEAMADDPSATGKRRVLRWASSGEPVRPSRTAQRQRVQEQSVRQTRVAATKTVAAKKAVKAPVAKKKAVTSSSSKRCRTPSSSPPPSDSTSEGHGDVIPEVGKEDQGLNGRQAPGKHFAHAEVDPPSLDQEDIDTVIKEVAKDTEAEDDKIAAEEAAKTVAEEATKGPAGEVGKAAAEEAGKAVAEVAGKGPAGEEMADDLPSSPIAPVLGKYLKVGNDLFVHLPGTASTRAPAEGEVFDDEALATTGLQVVDEPSASGGGSQEEQLLRAMSVNFQKLQALHRARLDKAKSRMAVADKAEADLEERVAQTQAWFREAREELKASQDELAERKRELILKQADVEKAQEVAKEQEEDLAIREEALTATLRGKDEEIGQIVVQRTQELEQRQKEELDAQAIVHAGKVKELELEWEELKKRVLALTEERDTANRTLADA